MKAIERMEKRTLCLVAALGILSAGSLAVRADDDFNQPSEVTFSRDVAPIFMAHCVNCHRPGEAAPMSLLSYKEARPWVKSIKTSVVKRDMPPWDADPAYGKFSNDISLSDQQIATIVKWVDQGAAEGDPSHMPKAPEYKDGWQLGVPDYVIELPEVKVPATGNDLFPNLTIGLDIPEKRWVRAVEVHPGNRDVLHHIVLFTSGVGMTSAAGTFDALAVWAVGTGPVIYPEGTGRWVNPKMRITSNMHYHPSGTEQTDKTTVALYFGQGELQKEINSALAGDINFRIPANVADYKLEADYYVNQDVKVISLFPHMHMRGKEMSFTAKYPDGREETLLRVPKYDFNWQWFYYPKTDLILPADTEIHITGIYDNTANNPNNPDPNQVLTFGEQSQEEMMFGFLEFVPVEGVKPGPVNAEKKLAKIVSKFPADEVYSIAGGMGMMSMKTRMHLPKNGGEGTWYIVFGGSVMPIKLEDVKWDGNKFAFNMQFMGGRMGTMVGHGTVDETGNIEGKFDMDPKMTDRMEEMRRNAGDIAGDVGNGRSEGEGQEARGERGEGRGRRGGGGGGMFMQSFKGTRAS